MRNIVVVSHRRSGTHLTIDMIRNNFSCIDRDYIDLDKIEAGNKGFFENKNPGIFKTHSHADYKKFFKHAQCIQLLENAKIIYVYRDGRDVMTSLFYYMKSYDKLLKDITFKDFVSMENRFECDTYDAIKNRMEFWAFHVNSWMNSDKEILFLSYEEIKTDYFYVLKKVSSFLNIPVNDTPTDVRLAKRNMLGLFLQRLCKKIFCIQTKHTAINFRTGISEDWKKFFDADLLRKFNVSTSCLLRDLNYE